MLDFLMEVYGKKRVQELFYKSKNLGNGRTIKLLAYKTNSELLMEVVELLKMFNITVSDNSKNEVKIRKTLKKKDDVLPFIEKIFESLGE